MTESKPRVLKKTELDDWFENDVTKRFFSQLDVDYDRLLQSRIEGGFYHPGEPMKTQEGFAFSAGMEHALQQMRDPANVRTRLEAAGENDDAE